MKLTVVMENTVLNNTKLPFRGEHGLSMLIETENKCFLYDAGQSELTTYNLSLLGLHPSDLDGIIISHGHYDHTGGLHPLLVMARKSMPVYTGKEIFMSRFSRVDGEYRFIGTPHVENFFKHTGAQFNFVDSPVKLTENLWISGSIPRVSTFEKGDALLVTQDDIQDTIPDDMTIYYKSLKGLVVITGCAHAGIINIIKYGMEVTGTQKLHALIGGTHLGAVSATQQDATVAELEKMQPKIVAANHCTGFPMMVRLKGIFGDKFLAASIGASIDL